MIGSKILANVFVIFLRLLLFSFYQVSFNFFYLIWKKQKEQKGWLCVFFFFLQWFIHFFIFGEEKAIIKRTKFIGWNNGLKFKKKIFFFVSKHVHLYIWFSNKKKSCILFTYLGKKKRFIIYVYLQEWCSTY